MAKIRFFVKYSIAKPRSTPVTNEISGHVHFAGSFKSRSPSNVKDIFLTRLETHKLPPRYMELLETRGFKIQWEVFLQYSDEKFIITFMILNWVLWHKIEFCDKQLNFILHVNQTKLFWVFKFPYQATKHNFLYQYSYLINWILSRQKKKEFCCEKWILLRKINFA